MFSLITRFVQVAAIVASFTASYASAGTMTATAESVYLTPPVGPVGDSIQNGDFFVTASSRGRGTGDGNDESTLWAFNFRTDRPQFTLFRQANPAALETAVVELHLESSNRGQTNDQLIIGSLPPIPVDTVAREGITVLHIDLLDYFDGVTLLDELRSLGDGILFVRYQDDSIVHHASLSVSYVD